MGSKKAWRKTGENPMKTWTLRLGLSLMVVVSFWTSRSPAQELLIVPETPYAPGYQPIAPTPILPRPAPPRSPYACQRCLNSHGVGCADDPFYPTCGSLHYELRFMFGSCHSFFDQPCAPAPWFKHSHR
jgi:hypothetical protein